MRINLKTSAARSEHQSLSIEIQDRLPEHLNSPCIINCSFEVKGFQNYYLVDLKSDSNLTVTCQRCLSDFSYPYSNQTELAVCNSEEIAEKMMDRYDCIVATNEVDLEELLTDELYLFTPEFHLDHNYCDREMDSFINPERE